MVLNVRFTAMLTKDTDSRGHALEKAALSDSEGSTENSAIRKYLPYLSKKSTNILTSQLILGTSGK